MSRIKGKNGPSDMNQARCTQRAPCRRGFFLLLFLITIFLGMITTMPSQAEATNYALVFDGKDDFASIPKDYPFTAFTVEAWVKPNLSTLNKSHVAFLRACFVEPPKTGDIETSQNSFVLFQNKGNPSQWGVRIYPTGLPYMEVMATVPLSNQEWQFIAATFDGINIALYRNGAIAGSGKVSGSIPKVLHTVIGRWVSSYLGQIGEIAVWKGFRGPDLISRDWQCGIVPDKENMFGYWKFDIYNSPTLLDETGNVSGSDIAYLGTNPIADRSDPTYAQATYSVVAVDSDLDGIPDGCDNCPEVYNPNQANYDGDKFGDVCDLCPKMPSEDNAYCEEVFESVTDVVGSVAHICFTYTPNSGDYDPVYLVEPNCFNTVITCRDSAGKIVPPADRLPPPTGIKFDSSGNFVEEDIIKFIPSPTDPEYERCIDCDLTEMYHPKVLAAVGPLNCETVYANSVQDPDLKAGVCQNEPCVDIWMGATPPAPFTTLVQKVEINIKPTSDPNIINLSGGGVLPVGIYSTMAPLFDATNVNPATLILRPDRANAESTCAPKWVHQDLNGDGLLDLLVHFEQLCLHFVPGDTKGILEGTTFPNAGGNGKVISITGWDEIVVFSK